MSTRAATSPDYLVGEPNPLYVLQISIKQPGLEGHTETVSPSRINPRGKSDGPQSNPINMISNSKFKSQKLF
jgi:hypothetical protein